MWQKLKEKLVERWRFLRLPYGQIAYGQNAEDLVLAKFLDGQLKDKKYQGFYIDIGAHHPFRYSNTYYFYQLGWRGLNIEADPQAVRLLKRCRPRDITVQALVGDSRLKKTDYYVFKDRAFNTADPKLAQGLIDQGRSQLQQVLQLPVVSVKKLLAEYLEPRQVVTFLNIDVEGLDLAVLKSYDFQRFRPRLILIEDLSLVRAKPDTNSRQIKQLLTKKHYRLVARVFNTAIWQSAI